MDGSVNWTAVGSIAQALATLLAAGALVFAAWQTLLSRKALLSAAQQTELHRKALEAETFREMLNTAREIDFSGGMDIIRGLKYGTYEEFKRSALEPTKAHIRRVVDFLNDIGHMLRYGYLTKQHVMNIYYPSLVACRGLATWWLTGFRNDHQSKYYYEHFEWMVRQAAGSEGDALPVCGQDDQRV